MNEQRYQLIERDGTGLTQEELDAGWHFCPRVRLPADRTRHAGPDEKLRMRTALPNESEQHDKGTAMTEPNDLKGELAELQPILSKSLEDVSALEMVPCWNFLRTHGARLKRALEERDALEKIALECFKAMAKYDPVGAKAFADSLEAARASEQAP